jgi:hypothetical protein
MLDLHTHSTFSDGSLAPAELVALARREGVGALALTDHDNTAGIAAFLRACAGAGPDETAVRGIPGVEISVASERGTLHLLGYCVQAGCAGLETVLARIRGGRADRNCLILDRLTALGMPLAWDDVASRAGSDVVGRPHFAQAMVARGYVRSPAQAFERFLAKGQPAYCTRYHPTPEEGLAAIAAAGGVAVLAHPATLELTAANLRRKVEQLREAGLQGIEVWYPEHTDDHTNAYLRLCREFDLVATGGSDYHGALNPLIRLGRGFSGLAIPATVPDELAARAGQVRIRATSVA